MLRLIFVLSIFIPGFFLALTNNFYAALFYIWFALFRPQDFIWIDISRYRLSLVIGLILIIKCFFRGHWPDIRHRISQGAILVLIFSLLAQTTSVNPEQSWGWVEYLVKLIVVCLLTTRLISTTNEIKIIIVVIACSLGFFTVKAGLVSFLGGGIQYAAGLGGSFTGNNGYALAAAMVTFFLVASGQMFKNLWVRYSLYGAGFLSMFTVVSTFSRGGLVALLAGLLAFALVQRRRLWLLAGFLILGLLFSAVVPIPKGYVSRIKTLESQERTKDISIESRYHFWRVSIAMAAAHPLGVGLRNYPEAYDSYDLTGGKYGNRRDVHSSYFQMLSEAGIGGGVVYTCLLFYTCLVLLRVRSRAIKSRFETEEIRFYFVTANGLLASMVCFMVGGLFGSYALNDLTWFSFAIIAALDRVSADGIKIAKSDLIQR
jgi:putative inorganic carbon (hco3(-)) transporter